MRFLHRLTPLNGFLWKIVVGVDPSACSIGQYDTDIELLWSNTSPMQMPDDGWRKKSTKAIAFAKIIGSRNEMWLVCVAFSSGSLHFPGTRNSHFIHISSLLLLFVISCSCLCTFVYFPSDFYFVVVVGLAGLVVLYLYRAPRRCDCQLWRSDQFIQRSFVVITPFAGRL